MPRFPPLRAACCDLPGWSCDGLMEQCSQARHPRSAADNPDEPTGARSLPRDHRSLGKEVLTGRPVRDQSLRSLRAAGRTPLGRGVRGRRAPARRDGAARPDRIGAATCRDSQGVSCGGLAPPTPPSRTSVRCAPLWPTHPPSDFSLMWGLRPHAPAGSAAPPRLRGLLPPLPEGEGAPRATARLLWGALPPTPPEGPLHTARVSGVVRPVMGFDRHPGAIWETGLSPRRRAGAGPSPLATQ